MPSAILVHAQKQPIVVLKGCNKWPSLVSDVGSVPQILIEAKVEWQAHFGVFFPESHDCVFPLNSDSLYIGVSIVGLV